MASNHRFSYVLLSIVIVVGVVGLLVALSSTSPSDVLSGEARKAVRISGLCGDTDNNRLVDVLGALFDAQYAYGLRALDVAAQQRGDVNRDCVINMVDARLIAERAAGLPRKLNCGTACAVITQGSCGDGNLDGRVSVLDSEIAAQHIAGLRPELTATQRFNLNVDGNCELNMADAQRIAQYATGLPVSLQCNLGCIARPAGPLSCGDLNGDAQITVLDSLLDTQFVQGVLTPTALQRVYGDVDGRVGLTIADAERLAQRATGLSVSLQCPCGQDGRCDAAICNAAGLTDPDCDPCGADGTCNTQCNTDPDCPICIADGWCEPRCTGGTDPDCTWCGDGRLDATEQCENLQGVNTFQGGATCTSLGFTGGTLMCTNSCQFDTSGCTSAGVCGDGVRDGNEECDGMDFGGATCVTRGYDGGRLRCLACRINEALCCDMATDPSCVPGLVETEGRDTHVG